MPIDNAKNFAKVIVDPAGYNDAVTSIDVDDASVLPAAPFNAVWWNATDYPDPSDDPGAEIVRVTAIATNTLTIVRNQEASGASDHSAAGKTFFLVAGLTAKTINEDVMPIERSGDSVQVTVVGILTLNSAFYRASAANVVFGLSGSIASMGDLDGNNTGVAVRADDNLGQVQLEGQVGTNQSASASAVGTVVAKMPIYNLAGTLLGYIPIYGSIT